MTADASNYNREYSLDGTYSPFQFEGSDVISVLKKLNLSAVRKSSCAKIQFSDWCRRRSTQDSWSIYSDCTVLNKYRAIKQLTRFFHETDPLNRPVLYCFGDLLCRFLGF